MILLSLITTFPQLKTKFVLAFVDKTGFLGTIVYPRPQKPINHSFRTSNLPGLVISCPPRSISYTKCHYLWGRKPECPEKIPIVELERGGKWPDECQDGSPYVVWLGFIQML
jgi:hypothetical protein